MWLHIYASSLRIVSSSAGLIHTDWAKEEGPVMRSLHKSWSVSCTSCWWLILNVQVMRRIIHFEWMIVESVHNINGTTPNYDSNWAFKEPLILTLPTVIQLWLNKCDVLSWTGCLYYCFFPWLPAMPLPTRAEQHCNINVRLIDSFVYSI